MAGYIPISRKFFKNKLWLQDREFSRAEAWIDLLALANYEDREKEVLSGNKVIKYSRGQLVASIRFLQNRWKWASTKRVFTFLQWLQGEDMIGIEKETGQNVITICNYASYNEIKIEGKREGNAKETPGKREGNKTNNTNNINNIINIDPPFGYSEFLELINSVKGKNFKGDKKSRPAFEARIKDGYTKDQFLTAIINCYNDPHHQENPNFLTPEFITRSDKLEMYLNYTPKSENKNQPAPAAAPDYKKKAAEQKRKEYK